MGVVNASIVDTVIFYMRNATMELTICIHQGRLVQEKIESRDFPKQKKINAYPSKKQAEVKK